MAARPIRLVRRRDSIVVRSRQIKIRPASLAASLFGIVFLNLLGYLSKSVQRDSRFSE
jgi:hypothetical protein